VAHTLRVHSCFIVYVPCQQNSSKNKNNDEDYSKAAKTMIKLCNTTWENDDFSDNKTHHEEETYR